MKMRIAAKGIAVLTASICLTAAFAGCAKKEETHTPTGATLEVTLEHSYKSEQLGIDHDLNVSELTAVGDYILQAGYNRELEQKEWYFYDPVSGELHDVFGYADAGTQTHPIEVIGVTEQDDTIVITYKSCNVLKEDPVVYGNYAYYQETYDSDLHLLSSEDITAYFGTELSVDYWACDRAGYYYAIVNKDGSNLLYCYDENYQLLGQIKGGFSNPHSVFCDWQGNAYLLFYAMGCAEIRRLDPANLAVEAVGIEGLPEWPGDMLPGNAAHHFYCVDESALWGVNIDTGTVDEIINWDSSDFEYRRIWDIVGLPDGSFYLAEQQDENPYEFKHYRLTERTQEELDNMQMISLASVGNNSVIQEMVRLYNRQSKDYRIVPFVYSEEYPDLTWEEQYERFKSDLTSGTVPDIIQLDAEVFELLSNKNVLEDLTPYLEAEEDFTDENYLMHFFDTLRYQDKLTRIGFTFELENTYVAKTEWIEDNTRLTAEDMPALLQTLPEGMQLTSNASREGLYYYFITSNLGAFVDADKGKCYFDTDAFVQLLEICSSASTTYVEPDKHAYRKDTALLCNNVVLCPYGYHEATAGYFDNADVTFVSYAARNDKGNGGQFFVGSMLGMCRESFYKEAVWDFFAFSLTQEVQEELMDALFDDQPVHRASLQTQIEKALQEPDEWNGNAEFEGEALGAATQEEMDEYLAFIEGVRSCGYSNTTISDIVDEEVQMYFAGDQTAEQAAKTIQSRVTLYLEEQQ